MTRKSFIHLFPLNFIKKINRKIYHCSCFVDKNLLPILNPNFAHLKIGYKILNFDSQVIFFTIKLIIFSVSK